MADLDRSARRQKAARGVHALCVLLIFAGLTLGVFAPVHAQGPIAPIGPEQFSNDPFAALVGKRRSASTEEDRASSVSRYVLATDDRALLFEERFRQARVTYLCAPGDQRLDCILDPQLPANEIYLLTSTRGPRGDVIYRNRQGGMMLRIASYGGATVYWPGDSRGYAASQSFGDDRALNLPFADYEAALRRARAAASYLAGHVDLAVDFEIGPAPAQPGAESSVLADGVMRAAKALARTAADPTGRDVLRARLKNVVFRPRSEASLAINGLTLEIGFDPAGGLEGRPSSAQISQFLESFL